ncbi:MAG TPA: DUF6314 family protein [Thermohalobaculum sp.]|nr:DUF6314 family protein [Thermohalobaculum sp.]
MEIATREWFEGAWVIRRQIDDRQAGERGRLVGRAVLEPSDEGLEYREEGLLEMNGRLLQAERRYRWRFEAEGRVRVLFADGSRFHSFIPGRPVADHLCGDDRYEVAYAFEEDRWSSRWDVRGPAKDYVLETWYSRVRNEDADGGGA